MSRAVQLQGIITRTVLAVAILYLIMRTFNCAMAKVMPDEKVLLTDAGLFTAFCCPSAKRPESTS